MDALIKECAKFNTRLSQKLSKQGLSFLVWSSPTGYRDPEETRLWHPSFLNYSFHKKTFIYICLIFIYSIIGIIRFFTYHGFFCQFLKKDSHILLVVPIEITLHADLTKTDYLIEKEGYEIDKIIFSKSKNIGPKFTKLSPFIKIKISTLLMHTLFNDLKESFHNKTINSYYLCCFVLFLRFVISQAWYFHWDFYHLLFREISLNKKYKILLSLHEMHFYSKIMWKICQEKNLTGITAQHAAITPEKLWYFSTELEINSKCPLPKVFYVFNENTKSLLQPFFPTTKFMLCCSPRYRKWRNSSLYRIPKQDGNNLNILFVSAIMFYDVSIVLKALKKLINSSPIFKTKNFKLILRLHPNAYIRAIDHLWIQWVSKILGVIEISSLKLENDLSRSDIAIGCSSTVLQEALLLNIPIFALYDPDYLTYSVVPSSWKTSIENLTWEKIQSQIKIKTQNDPLKDHLGLSNPDLTTQLIYQNS